MSTIVVVFFSISSESCIIISMNDVVKRNQTKKVQSQIEKEIPARNIVVKTNIPALVNLLKAMADNGSSNKAKITPRY